MKEKKSIIILLVVLLSLPTLVFPALEGDSKSFFEQVDRFFSKTVKGKTVDYRAVHAEPEFLAAILELVKKMDIESLSEQETKAFWINLYNLLVIQRVIDHYPIQSPKDVPGFFESPFFRLGGKKYSLDEIEKGILYKQFPDARLHFVLVCAANGCPPLAPSAYFPDGLNDRIETQTRKALDDPGFVRLDEANEGVRVSEIFRWYRSHFPSSKGGIIAFINKFRQIPIPTHFKVDYYTYDWRLNDVEQKKGPGQKSRSNLAAYTPSVLLPKRGIELKIFNNLYSQTAFFNEEGKRTRINQRQSYFTTIIQFLYGVSKHRRLNIGFDINLKSVHIGPHPGTSPFDLFSFNGGDLQRTAITTVGPKLKVAPFRSIPRLSIQSSLLFPVSDDLEGTESDKPFLEYQRTVWWTQVFFDFDLASRLQVFSELDFLLRFKNGLEDPQFLMPVSVFLNYFPGSRMTVYTMLQYSPTLSSSSTYYTQWGVGSKFQLTHNLELELLATTFFAGSNAGAGVTYNIGFRYIKQ